MTEFLFQYAALLLLKMFAVVLFSPVFLLPSTLVAGLGMMLGNILVKAQLSVKREMSKSKAPVLGHFGAAMNGISEYPGSTTQLSFLLTGYDRTSIYPRVWCTTAVHRRIQEAN